MQLRAMQLVVLLAGLSCALALDNGVALPPLGWSTWNTLRANFNETILRDIADIMVSSGLVAAGYTRLNIDDGWPERERAADGSLVPDGARFPSGMLALSTYLTARGMSLGIYTSHCKKTCLGFPGALGHETQDAALYASWGVRLVKNDNCANRVGFPSCNDTEAFTAMRDALNATGLQIAYQVRGLHGAWGGCDLPLVTGSAGPNTQLQRPPRTPSPLTCSLAPLGPLGQLHLPAALRRQHRELVAYRRRHVAHVGSRAATHR